MSSPPTPLGIGFLRQRWFVVVPALVAAGVVITLLFKLIVIHGRFGDWTLSPSAFPSKVTYHGREYDRDFSGASADPRLIAADSVRVGSTGDGGSVYAPPGEKTPTVLVVKTAHESRSYALAGGP